MLVMSNVNPRNITIFKRFYNQIYKQGTPRDIDVSFPHYSNTIEVEQEIALFLIQNYDGISIVNDLGENLSISDDLDLIKRNDLIKLACKYFLGYKDVFQEKTDIVKSKIREQRNKGVIPMNDKEYSKYRENERKEHFEKLKNSEHFIVKKRKVNA